MALEIQFASDVVELPSDDLLVSWVALATGDKKRSDVLIRIVDEDESAELNQSYRQKAGPTNVLSFTFEVPEGLPEEAAENAFLGDLVICAPVVLNEAIEQTKPIFDHWAHMVIHGCLHLQGYDHIEPDQARVMERLETDLLARINIPNPYDISY